MKPPAATQPDPRRATATVIPPNVLVHVLNHADLRDLDTRPWFSGLGLTRRQLLEPEVRVSYHQARTILLRALATFDEPGLGLVVGRRERLGSFGVLGLLMLTSASFGEAVRLGIENHRVSGSLMDLRFESLPGQEVALALWPRFDDPQLLPFLCEEIITSSLQLARELVGSDFALKRIDLTYAKPSYAALYADTLGITPRFETPQNHAVLDARWLQVPLPGHNPLAARQALDMCKTQLRQAHDNEQEIVALVKQLLREHLRDRPRLDEVARWLHLSERSLRRRLATAGRAFREVHDEVRTDRALAMLRDRSTPVMTVAEAVGFSDAREFRRAFKRWTGVSPQAARNGHTQAHVGRFDPP